VSYFNYVIPFFQVSSFCWYDLAGIPTWAWNGALRRSVRLLLRAYLHGFFYWRWVWSGRKG
jgi:hypothetical protein